MRFEHASAFARAIPAADMPSSTVRLDVSMVGGELHAIAWDKDGQRVRLNAGTLNPEALPGGFFAQAAATMRPECARRGIKLADGGRCLLLQPPRGETVSGVPDSLR